MFCGLETVDFSLGEVGYFIIYQKPKKRKNKANFVRKYIKYFIKFLKTLNLILYTVLFYNFEHSVILSKSPPPPCPKVACSRDCARDFFVFHSGEQCIIVSRTRRCEGDSLISSVSRDTLSTNETHEKKNFDDWYIIKHFILVLVKFVLCK